jgi:hypothetical protein
MADDYNYGTDPYEKTENRISRLPPGVKAALILGLPFIAINAFNIFSLGSGLAISLPVEILLYTVCGFLAGKFAGDLGKSGQELILAGATAGVCLWGFSTLVNLLINLIAGSLTFGGMLIFGIPYMCLCAPAELVGGGLAGTLGGFLYGVISGKKSESEDNEY